MMWSVEGGGGEVERWWRGGGEVLERWWWRSGGGVVEGWRRCDSGGQIIFDYFTQQIYVSELKETNIIITGKEDIQ